MTQRLQPAESVRRVVFLVCVLMMTLETILDNFRDAAELYDDSPIVIAAIPCLPFVRKHHSDPLPEIAPDELWKLPCLHEGTEELGFAELPRSDDQNAAVESYCFCMPNISRLMPAFEAFHSLAKNVGTRLPFRVKQQLRVFKIRRVAAKWMTYLWLMRDRFECEPVEYLDQDGNGTGIFRWFWRDPFDSSIEALKDIIAKQIEPRSNSEEDIRAKSAPSEVPPRADSTAQVVKPIESAVVPKVSDRVDATDELLCEGFGESDIDTANLAGKLESQSAHEQEETKRDMEAKRILEQHGLAAEHYVGSSDARKRNLVWKDLRKSGKIITEIVDYWKSEFPLLAATDLPHNLKNGNSKIVDQGIRRATDELNDALRKSSTT